MVTPRSVLRFSHLLSGCIALQGVVPVLVRNRIHQFEELEFLVDPGAGVTTVTIELAVERQIPFPKKSVVMQVKTASGSHQLPVHSGPLVVRIPGFEGREFTWPCHFVSLGDDLPRSLLGLGGILNDLRITFDGAYSVEAPHGCVVLEEVGP